MLGLGRYSQHKKLNTQPDKEDFSEDEHCGSDDDDDLSTFRIPQENDAFQVTFLSEETLSAVEGKDYQDIVKDVTKQRFLTMNALSQSKRLCLSINEIGLTVTPNSGKPTNDSLNETFETPELVFISSSTQYKKVLTLICRKCNEQTNATLYVFVCQNEKDPRKILDLCAKRISKGETVLDIKRQGDPDSLRFIYNAENSRPGKLNIKEDRFENQNTTKDVFSPSSNFDLDDEFSQLALKRNERLPEHMQDKTVESALLIQSSDFTPNKSHTRTNSSNMANNSGNNFFVSNFFSSPYSRVSSGLK
uniref:Uncharacterized protein n=1 Tax=Clytia hemisphaerica TaxID=252671 RepID=A0A7M5XK44_9CNID